MTYLALARQWRPRSFETLLGQELVNKALTNALRQQRLHHAYLFTGTRGVGKTSVARLFAKALNCEQGISPTPCLTCETCVSIEQGRFVDLLEIDGASKTRVEDTRDLLENVQYAPTCGRFKIYLIDEVHMLSQHSFNALLKTLEEPPAHVKFLLATTDPQKLPPTILSRCLQFHLQPISIELIQGHLATILAQEAYEAEPQALSLIAQAANGSMRDALSILEQVIACSTEKVTAATVKTLLGYTQQDYAKLILQALQSNDAESLFEISEQIAKEGGHYPHVLERMLHDIYQLAKLKHFTAPSVVRPQVPELDSLAGMLDVETIQLWYQITLKSISDQKLAPHPRIGFEMCLLRLLAFQPTKMPKEPQVGAEVSVKSVPSPERTALPEMPAVQTALLESAPLPASVITSPPEPALTKSSIMDLILEQDPIYPEDETEGVEEIEQPLAKIEPAPAPVVEQEVSWPALLSALKLSGMVLIAAEQAELETVTAQSLSLRVTPAHQSLFTPNVMKQLETALSGYYQHPMKVRLVSTPMLTASPALLKKNKQIEADTAAHQALQSDPTFQRLQNEFGAEVIPESVQLEPPA